jgi:queuine tRNA-ribosyltransferase
MNPPGFSFEVTARDNGARAGRLTTPHGTLATPAFVAVGTQATLKALTPEQARAAGVELIFANTYHLYLRPGPDIVAAHGGLHRFMNWDGPILTDSGGFQVFSLGAGLEHGVGKIGSIFPGEGNPPPAPAGAPSPQASLVQVGEDGVRFKSHIDGSLHVFTPEKSISVQRALGADMILAFDECTSPLHDEAYTARSAERTHRWAERSLRYFGEHGPQHGYPQALYGIVQGGAFEAVRRESARVIAAMPFGGLAIGGNLGQTHADMYRVLEWTVPELPAGKPRHLLGIGDVPGILEGVARGVDTFDCVSPTRNARNGGLLARSLDGEPLKNFRMNLRSARYAEDMRPVDETCDCYLCTTYSRAYLRHLFKANESLAQTLATLHNLRFMARLMRDVRESVRAGRFADLKAEWLDGREAPTG